MVSQLYIRQALQMAVDQTGVITNVDKGYGFPIYSPLPPNTRVDQRGGAQPVRVQPEGGQGPADLARLEGGRQRA